ncbi:hypothetical protein HHK36_014279 [Tetracentron sinense]|uniref:Protein arginine N-methyltransferase domain-containing protein n=1 Tax=Tetracentron sinense TaxID=13715 RepID=A0A834Z8H3_TETSI|nr:hypothetical protein HHK36_014279 [Tetracentron sinense]
MGRRKGNNKSSSGNSSNNFNHHDTNPIVEDQDFEDTTESSNLDNTNYELDESIIGSDKTSADYYFDSYSHFGIHEFPPFSSGHSGFIAALCRESQNSLSFDGLRDPWVPPEMLKDTVRTKTYQNVIYQNPFLFKNKVVLDVGAGTGILSLFCAKAGAKHVYAVECSQMADMAKEIVEANGFSNVITVMKGKVEEIVLPVAQVDIIISEWMGYFLLFENMLNTVLYARDKWLISDGIVLPDKASLYLTAIEDAEYKEDKIEFWNNVYGFSMSCIKKQAMMEPLVDTVDQNQITMDISKMAPGDASFTAPFKLVAERSDYIHALVAYFDVSFTKWPRSRATHWKQTVLYLEDVLTICEGEAVVGSMTVAPNKKNPRDVDIMLKYTLNGLRCQVSRTQHYKMR